ncbi:MAG: histidine phosphatase family protein [Anaerolineae bacterium]
MITLILARHGQSHGNLDHSLGQDTGLTDLGREQASRLGRWLVERGYKFTALYCSPLRRACQTAEIVNAHFGLEIAFEPDLRESEGDHLSGRPRRANPLDADHPPPFGPEYEGLRERVARATGRILAENPEGQVLVVAHAGTLGTMLRCILSTHALLVHTEFGAVHALRWEDGRWILHYLNRTPSWPAEGFTLSTNPQKRSRGDLSGGSPAFERRRL